MRLQQMRSIFKAESSLVCHNNLLIINYLRHALSYNISPRRIQNFEVLECK